MRLSDQWAGLVGKPEPTPQEVEDYLAVEVRGWQKRQVWPDAADPTDLTLWDYVDSDGIRVMNAADWHPLTDANQALMLVAQSPHNWDIRIRGIVVQVEVKQNPNSAAISSTEVSVTDGLKEAVCEALCLASALAAKEAKQ